MTLTSSRHQIELRDVAISQIFGGGGRDTATLLDDTSNDRFTLALNRVELKTVRHQVTVENFSQVNARSFLDRGRDTIRRMHQSLGYVFKKFGDWIEV